MQLSHEEMNTLKKLKKVIEKLTAEELKAFSYIWDNISVGEILFEREITARYGIEKPYLVARSLREKSLIERGEGCYNLATWLKPLRKKIKHFIELVKLIEKYGLI